MAEYPNPIRIGNFYPPQVYNAAKNEFEMLEGSDGAYKAQTIQTVSAYYIEDSGNFSKEFTEDMHGLSIYNGSDSEMRFVINGISRPVFPKGTYNQIFKEPFRSISIIASGSWYIDVLQQLGASMAIVTPELPDTTAPDNVTDLQPSNVTQNSAILTWTASVSADTVGYEIWRGGALLTTVTGTTYNATGLASETQYTFSIRAYDAAGNVASGTSVNVTTAAQPADITPPENVTGLTAGTPTQNSVSLSWQASSSSDVKDYRVYNGAALIATVTGLSYNVTGLTASTAYTFTVRARDKANNEALGASVNVTTAAPVDTTPPVVTISPSGGTFTAAQPVTITANEPAAIYYTTNGSDPTESDSLYSSAITVSATTTLKARARDTAGNWGSVVTANFTITVPDTTPPDPVSNLAAGTPAANSMPLTWTLSPSNDVTAQEVAYSTDGSSFTVASSSVNPSSTSYIVKGLAAETQYTLRVVAIDGAGNRSAAVTVTATTSKSVTEDVTLYFLNPQNRPTTAASGTWKTGAFLNKQSVLLTDIYVGGNLPGKGWVLFDVDGVEWKIGNQLASGVLGTVAETDANGTGYLQSTLETPINLNAGAYYAIAINNSVTGATLKYGNNLSNYNDDSYISVTDGRYVSGAAAPEVGVSLIVGYVYDIKIKVKAGG